MQYSGKRCYSHGHRERGLDLVWEGAGFGLGGGWIWSGRGWIWSGRGWILSGRGLDLVWEGVGVAVVLWKAADH